jgi:3-dehydroquinate synthase
MIMPGLFGDLAAPRTHQWKGKDVFVITDSHVRTLYGQQLMRSLAAQDARAWMLHVPAGEHSKNARVAFALQTHLLEKGIRRDSIIVALGGGVVGDLAGYVAATILRGVKYIQVPTTLVAQVDSSVGGKVGIDHPLGKNLIGAFYQPAAVYIDPEVLATLPVEEFRNGLAEVVKIAVALDAKLFDKIESQARRITQQNVPLLTDLIVQAVRLKADVVMADAFDSGVRKMLNLGHTIGHALEAASNFKIKHGAAVAIGLAAESGIAVRMSLLDRRDGDRLIKVLRALRLPTKMPRISSKAKFMSALSIDKKSEGNSAKFVLLKAIGQTSIGVDVPARFIEELL